jgi:transposase InsO family protein
MFVIFRVSPEFDSKFSRGTSRNMTNGKLREELLNGEIFTTLLEAKVLIENWGREYNTIRPHSSLGYKPPAPEAMLPCGENPLVEELTLEVVQ